MSYPAWAEGLVNRITITLRSPLCFIICKFFYSWANWDFQLGVKQLARDERSKTHEALLRNRTRLTESISYDDNHYVTSPHPLSFITKTISSVVTSLVNYVCHSLQHCFYAYQTLFINPLKYILALISVCFDIIWCMVLLSISHFFCLVNQLTAFSFILLFI